MYYPPDIVKIIINRWDHVQKISMKGDNHKNSNTSISLPPFPTIDELKIILDVLYHVSFLTEEDRRIAVRIVYIHPDDFKNQLPSYMNHYDRPIPFSRPIRFNVSEVLRLTPALEPTISAIAICSIKEIESFSVDSPLAIWGIFKSG